MNDVVTSSIRESTERQQARAADPEASAWVSANAGTGKTYVLVQRILRLLLSGTPPQRILCLTFTKAAASEMSNRLFRRLSEWTIYNDREVNEHIGKILGRPPSQVECDRARRMFADALETPGGLKVQTIHAFCERLLHRFPLEAQIAPNFVVLDEAQESALRRQVIEKILKQASEDDKTDLGHALRTITFFADEDRFISLIDSLLSKRILFQEHFKKLEGSRFGREELLGEIKSKLGISHGLDLPALRDRLSRILSEDQIKTAAGVLATGQKSDQKLGLKFEQLLQTHNPEARLAVIQNIFLTDKKKEPRKRLVTNRIKEENETLVELLLNLQQRVLDLVQEIDTLRLAEASTALIVVSKEISRAYKKAKLQRSSLDFDDLIEKTSDLLSSSYASSWVLYKLDGGIDHILVDEAQDTSPMAWNIIDKLTDEFFSGESQSKDARTIFAVGDEKQSIYGFQGADPRKFAGMGDLFKKKAEMALLDLHNIPLNQSFRSTYPILHAVDTVFQDQRLLQAVTSKSENILHHAFRQDQAGLIEVWDTEKAEKIESADPWNPAEEFHTDLPVVQLSKKIARRIQHWLASETKLRSSGRPITPGDILILVRRREPFAPHMIRELKALNIPVAGADRIRITEQLAVMDLMVLAEFILLPEDDLSLATLLKSPFFNLSDDQLLEIRNARKGALWEALQHRSDSIADYKAIVSTLKNWLARADLVPPFEFFAGLLTEDDRREKMIARLGPEAGDAIDEFLNMAIHYDDLAPPSLQGFINWIKKTELEIKRDMEQGRNEVRVMTVHGAKGLEAPIVFLPDTCSTRSGGVGETLYTAKPQGSGASDQLIWTIPDLGSLEFVQQARRAKSDKERDEYYRLLYVAMTRARDELYICGYESSKGKDTGCWYDVVRDGLADKLLESKHAQGHKIWQFISQNTKPVEEQVLSPGDSEVPVTLPDWALEPAPRERMKTIPVAPSYLVPLKPEDMPDDRVDDSTIQSPIHLAEHNRFARGLLTHTLLEYLPNLDPETWEAAANRLVEARRGDLSQEIGEQIVAEVLEVLNNEKFGSLFGPDSQAEVSVSARIVPDEEEGVPVLISGQIDRLAIRDREILIVDYKTNRPPPSFVQDVADSYIAQLAAYRYALREIYPDKTVTCSILWTYGPAIMEIPSEFLDQQEKELYRVAAKRT